MFNSILPLKSIEIHSLGYALRTRTVLPNLSDPSDAGDVRQLWYIDTFVITRWRHELHTAHYTAGYYLIYNSGE